MFAFHTLGLRTIKPRMAKRTGRDLLGLVVIEVLHGLQCSDALRHVPDDR